MEDTVTNWKSRMLDWKGKTLAWVQEHPDWLLAFVFGFIAGAVIL